MLPERVEGKYANSRDHNLMTTSSLKIHTKTQFYTACSDTQSSGTRDLEGRLRK